jgi:hypothetical protein
VPPHPPPLPDDGTITGWNDDGKTDNVIVKFTDGTVYWFPVADVTKWLANDQPDGPRTRAARTPLRQRAPGAGTPGTPLTPLTVRPQSPPAAARTGMKSPGRGRSAKATPATPKATATPVSPRTPRGRAAAAAAAAKQPATPAAVAAPGKAPKKSLLEVDAAAAYLKQQLPALEAVNATPAVLAICALLVAAAFAGAVWLAFQLPSLRPLVNRIAKV